MYSPNTICLEALTTRYPKDMQVLNPLIVFSQFINMAQIWKSFYKLGFTRIGPDLNSQNICGSGKITLKYGQAKFISKNIKKWK